MSHTATLPCTVTCSIDVMKSAILRLFPNWVNHIQTDQSGKLVATNQHTQTDYPGQHIVVKGRKAGGASELPYADAGFRFTNGQWMIDADPMSQSALVRNLPHAIEAEVNCMRQLNILADAGLSQAEIDIQRSAEGNIVMDFSLTTEQLEALVGGMQ